MFIIFKLEFFKCFRFNLLGAADFFILDEAPAAIIIIEFVIKLFQIGNYKISE